MKVSGTGRGKAPTYGIFAPTARDGLNPIILSYGLNRLVAKFVVSARKKGFRKTAVPILSRLFINQLKRRAFRVLNALKRSLCKDFAQS
jgi:hypothetical protein